HPGKQVAPPRYFLAGCFGEGRLALAGRHIGIRWWSGTVGAAGCPCLRLGICGSERRGVGSRRAPGGDFVFNSTLGCWLFLGGGTLPEPLLPDPGSAKG